MASASSRSSKHRAKDADLAPRDRGVVIVLLGTSSSGKSTFLERDLLPRTPSLTPVTADGIFDLLRTEHPYTPNAKLQKLVPERLLQEIEAARTCGDVIVDHVVSDFVQHIPQPVFVIAFYTPLKTVMKLNLRRRPGDARSMFGILKTFVELYKHSNDPRDEPLETLSRHAFESLFSTPTSDELEKAEKAWNKMKGPQDPREPLRVVPRFKADASFVVGLSRESREDVVLAIHRLLACEAQE